jgi:hypothetical protein
MTDTRTPRLTQRVYVGCTAGRREVFRCNFTPTAASHGDQYAAVIGPFRTVRGARFMAEHGEGNPHCLSVADAERIAKSEQRNREAMDDFNYVGSRFHY